MKLVEIGKVESSHVGLPNMKIYWNESLPDLKRGNLKFGRSRGKMVFLHDKGSITITLNMQLIITLIRWRGILGQKDRNCPWSKFFLHPGSNLGGSNDLT